MTGSPILAVFRPVRQAFGRRAWWQRILHTLPAHLRDLRDAHRRIAATPVLRARRVAL
jgi:hypothetical protein